MIRLTAEIDLADRAARRTLLEERLKALKIRLREQTKESPTPGEGDDGTEPPAAGALG